MEQALISAYTLEYLDNMRREIAVGKFSGFSGKFGNILELFGEALESEVLDFLGG